jgi:adenylate cyclase
LYRAIHHPSLYPIAEYTFAHPLTQEVALGSQLQERRRKTHAAVAQAIRDTDPERLDQHAALLAHHYEEAGEALAAAQFHARAATWMGTKDLNGTLRHWQHARDLVRALPGNDEVDALRLMACLQILAMGGFRLGLSEAAVDELYEEGSQLAERTGNAVMLVLLASAYGARLAGLGRARECHELNVETLAAADATGIRDIRAGARIGLCYAAFLVGRLAESLRYIDEGLAITGSDNELGRREFGFSYRVFFFTSRTLVLAAMGKLDEARREMAQALRVARESGIPENLGWAVGVLPYLGEWAGEPVLGDLGDVKAGALESLRIAEELGSAFSRSLACQAMSSAHLTAGAYEDAERYCAAALDLARTRRVNLQNEPLVLVGLARARLASGKAAEARAAAEEAVALAQERGLALAEMAAQIALASALCADEGVRARAAAERALKRASELVEETGGRVYEPQIAEARAHLAQICADVGARDRFRREARQLYARIGATGHARRIDSLLH